MTSRSGTSTGAVPMIALEYIMPRISSSCICLMAALFPALACANEVFAGLFSHGVQTPFSMETEEGGPDLQLGARFAPLERLGAMDPGVSYVGALTLLISPQ
jgi:hypothetical protein